MALGRHLFLFSCLGVFVAGVLGSGAGSAGQSAARSAHSKVDFNRDIRPIITKCFARHGRDAKALMANLRLDDRVSATSVLDDGRHAIVPGHPERSELIRRVFSTYKNELMPPPESNKTLSSEDKAMLKAWI